MDHSATSAAPRSETEPRHMVPPMEDVRDPVAPLHCMPPQEGVKTRVIGRFTSLPAQIHVLKGDEASQQAVASQVKITTWKDKEDRVHAKLMLGDKPQDGSERPGIPFRGTVQHPQDQKFDNPAIASIHLASEGRSFYVTDQANDPNLVRGYRAVVISVPGHLQIAIPNENTRLTRKPGIKVLAQGREEIRVQPGNYLTKAVLAIPVDEQGKAKESEIHAFRAFGNREPKLMTPKFSLTIDGEGIITMSQVPGLQAVKIDRENKKLAATPGAPRPPQPAPVAATRPQTPVPTSLAPAPAPAFAQPARAKPVFNIEDEPPF